MYCVMLCDRPYLQHAAQHTEKSILLDPEFLTQYKKYFVELGASTKYKLCYVEIFLNKEGNFT